MQLLVIANGELKAELLQDTIHSTVEAEWISDTVGFEPSRRYDACIDLLFENTPGRIAWLHNKCFDLVMINAVVNTLGETDTSFVRFNGWPTFIHRPVVEAAALDETAKRKSASLFESLNKNVEWVPDINGFITPRVVSSVINEAYFALDESVSSASEIDTAMKLGTNYPFGPFEWAEKIGLSRIVSLLEKLAAKEQRYTPCSLLKKMAGR